MKNLLKISDYYYVVDDNDSNDEKGYGLTLGKYIIHKNEILKVTEKLLLNISDLRYNKHIIYATTNPSLPLPQIINASDELVGKEVEIMLEPNIITKFGVNEVQDVFAFLKPISKETSLRLPDDDIFGETSTNETLE